MNLVKIVPHQYLVDSFLLYPYYQNKAREKDTSKLNRISLIAKFFWILLFHIIGREAAAGINILRICEVFAPRFFNLCLISPSRYNFIYY